MTDTEKSGLLDGVPIEILDAYERRAKNVAALWGNAAPAARQAVLVSMLRAWHSGRAFGDGAGVLRALKALLAAQPNYMAKSEEVAMARAAISKAEATKE